MPRSRTSHRRTKPFGEDDTLTSSIGDLIIDTIFEIRQTIEAIAHSKTKEYHGFQILLDIPKGDSTLYDFPKTKDGGCRPLQPLETNPPCTNPPYPRLNFNFLANMEANRPWLAIDAIAVPGVEHPLPKHPKKLLPKFDP